MTLYNITDVQMIVRTNRLRLSPLELPIARTRSSAPKTRSASPAAANQETAPGLRRAPLERRDEHRDDEYGYGNGGENDVEDIQFRAVGGHVPYCSVSQARSGRIVVRGRNRVNFGSPPCAVQALSMMSANT